MTLDKLKNAKKCMKILARDLNEQIEYLQGFFDLIDSRKKFNGQEFQTSFDIVFKLLVKIRKIKKTDGRSNYLNVKKMNLQ